MWFPHLEAGPFYINEQENCKKFRIVFLYSTLPAVRELAYQLVFHHSKPFFYLL
jgi:hypothetical protein